MVDNLFLPLGHGGKQITRSSAPLADALEHGRHWDIHWMYLAVSMI